METETITDLGWANGWRETPIEYIKCRKQGHEIEGRNIGICATEHYCPICKITWMVDSSG